MKFLTGINQKNLTQTLQTKLFYHFRISDSKLCEAEYVRDSFITYSKSIVIIFAKLNHKSCVHIALHFKVNSGFF